jgi:parallel beta helix pectate lyase-like protein
MHLRNVLRIAGAFMATALLAGTAHAQLGRAYVAPVALGGNDANDCTLPTPCRLLPAALAAIADGGEIWMLGSANYNVATVNIAKSVSILAIPGAVGSVVATATGGGPAINIATPLVKVSLRNLVIAPLAGAFGTSGIVMTDGAALNIEKCQIAGLPESGIDVSGAVRVLITDTTIRDNGRDGLLLQNGANGIVARSMITGNNRIGGDAGIAIVSSGDVITTADIAYSTISGNLYGVIAWSTDALGVVKSSVRASQVVQNGLNLYAKSDLGGAVTLSASNNIITQGDAGIRAEGAGAKVWATGNTVSGNVVALDNTGGVLDSASNNAVRNNTASTTGTITPIATQ